MVTGQEPLARMAKAAQKNLINTPGNSLSARNGLLIIGSSNIHEKLMPSTLNNGSEYTLSIINPPELTRGSIALLKANADAAIKKILEKYSAIRERIENEK